MKLKYFLTVCFLLTSFIPSISYAQDNGCDVENIKSRLSDRLDNAESIMDLWNVRAEMGILLARCSESEVGASRSNPVPFGETQFLSNGEISITVVNLLEEEDLSETVTTDENVRLVVVQLEFACNKSEDDTCTYNQYDFSIVGDSGVINSETIFTGGFNTSAELFGGSRVQVDRPFHVGVTEEGLLFIWDDSSSNRIFFATE
ncbi:MAG: hypothetical protein L0154_21485 [Chloroflexi bacterium]|nr:hypothetical protein [Chloroflexota bacterium]